ncbi:MAG: hypothetical protein FWF94_03060 [Oscillospiraceae bacterium]|nr:hypothetical protein [Oscillospiraceae bacterium]
MPSNKNADLKSSYFDLLMIRYKNKGHTVIGLDESILRLKSTMDGEDVAYVDKQFNEWLKSQ